MANKTPTRLSAAQKAEALNYAERRGFDAAGRKYGVHPNTVRAWRRRLKPSKRGEGKGQVPKLQAEIKRLKTNNQKLRDKIKAIRVIVKGRA